MHFPLCFMPIPLWFPTSLWPIHYLILSELYYHSNLVLPSFSLFLLILWSHMYKDEINNWYWRMTQENYPQCGTGEVWVSTRPLISSSPTIPSNLVIRLLVGLYQSPSLLSLLLSSPCLQVRIVQVPFKIRHLKGCFNITSFEKNKKHQPGKVLHQLKPVYPSWASAYLGR